MPPYTLDNPLSSGLATATGVMAAQQQAKMQKAALERQTMLDRQRAEQIAAQQALAQATAQNTQAYRQGQLGQGQQRLEIEGKRLDISQQAATTAEKREAAAEADRQRTADLAAAKFKYQQDHDAAALAERTATAEQAHRDRQAAIKAATTRSQLQSATTLQAAGMREAGATARFQQGQAGTESRFDRGQQATQNRFDTTQKRLDAAKKPPIQDERSNDYAQGLAVIKANPSAKNTVIQRFAAKYNMPVAQAQALFP